MTRRVLMPARNCLILGSGRSGTSMLAGTLAGIEMGLEVAGIEYRKGGICAALDYLAGGNA